MYNNIFSYNILFSRYRSEKVSVANLSEVFFASLFSCSVFLHKIVIRKLVKLKNICNLNWTIYEYFECWYSSFCRYILNNSLKIKSLKNLEFIPSSYILVFSERFFFLQNFKQISFIHFKYRKNNFNTSEMISIYNLKKYIKKMYCR